MKEKCSVLNASIRGGRERERSSTEWSSINKLSFHLDNIEIEEEIKCELKGGEKIKIMAEINRAEKYKAKEN